MTTNTLITDPSATAAARLATRVCLAAICCLSLLIAAAPASARKPLTIRRETLSIKLTGLHQISWHVQDPAYPDPNRAWVEGRGMQTLRFSTPRPLRFTALLQSGQLPNGIAITPLVLEPLAASKPLPGVISRTQSWHHNDDMTCDSEGHCDNLLVPPIHHIPVCPQWNVAVAADLAVNVTPARHPLWQLAAQFPPTSAFDGLWTSCPPDIDDVKRPLAPRQPPALGFAGAIKHILHMRRGSSVTIKAGIRRGARNGAMTSRCPDLAGAGQQECALTQLTLDITRER